jgi:hypothetical protein
MRLASSISSTKEWSIDAKRQQSIRNWWILAAKED